MRHVVQFKSDMKPKLLTLNQILLIAYEARLATFQNWPHAKPSQAAMADAGFSYRPDLNPPTSDRDKKADTVTCEYCEKSGNIRDWSPKDNPLTQHLFWYPNCKIAQMMKKALVPATTDDSNPNKSTEPHYRRLATVYCAAEKYSMTELKNGLIDILFRLKRTEPRLKPPSIGVVSLIYDKTPTKSPLRKLMVAW